MTRETPAPRRYRISVIMPIYNARRYLERSLPPLVDALKQGRIAELIAVDDTSSDGSGDLAAQLGARVIPSGGRLGPGGARNVAARNAVGDILWFVDADVRVAGDAVDRIEAAFACDDTWAVFGSYDAAPPEPNFGSQYKNLLHHHHHQRGSADAETFWAGCGAVRRDRFQQVGGFDTAQPSVEDIELGYRIREHGGRVVLDRDLLCTHLKRWSVGDVIRVDVFQRALPWSRLMLRRGSVDKGLNVSWVERLRAALAGVLLLSMAASAAMLLPFWAPLLVAVIAVAANASLFSTFSRIHGPVFALAALLFHQVYYLYSTAAFLWCWVERQLAPRRR